jgi:hypothetical protein
MVKACAKFGARRASVRETRQKEVMHGQGKRQLTKKKEIKKRSKKNVTLFRNDGDTLTRTSDLFQNEPRLGEGPVLEQLATRRTADVAADKGQWEGFLAGAALQSATPASSRVRERNSSPQHIRENSPGKGARPSSPTKVAEPNQDRDMRAQENSSAAAEDLTKSDGEAESPSDDVDEEMFLENLDKLAASGELDTVEGVKQAFINAFGEEMIVSGDLVFNLVHKLLQRTDSFNRLVKNYEDKQDEMMRAQRNFVKDEMAYLHRKMREQLTKDSTVLAKVMQETHDKREVELKQLRTENKKSAIDLALHISDFQLYQRKYAAPSGAEELTQCKKELRDAQMKSLLKDDEIQALELHIHMLKGLMHTHGRMLLPLLLHLRQITHPHGAILMFHLLSICTTTVGVQILHPLLLLLKKAITNIQMKAWTHRMVSTGRTLIIRNIKAKAKRDQEANRATPLTPKESEDVTRMKMTSVNVKSSKRLGTLMVRPLLKIGLSPC